MSPMRIYRAASAPVKHQCALTILFLVVVIALHVVQLVAFADSGSGSVGSVSSWVTPSNILAAVAFIYGAGMLREQFLDVRTRIREAEVTLKKLAEETLPETYVRQDVLEERLRPLEDLFRPTWSRRDEPPRGA